jgi:hypothetical protein
MCQNPNSRLPTTHLLEGKTPFQKLAQKKTFSQPHETQLHEIG